MPDGTVHSEARFVFFRGTVAVWDVDMLNWSATQSFRATGAKFLKRKSAQNPHLVQLADETVIQVKPLYSGGCNCDPHPLKEYGTEQLISESFTHTPAVETVT